MAPNIHVGLKEGSAMYHKWYFEAIVDHIEYATQQAPQIRIGWANTDGFVPYPGGGEGWGGNGAGDDLYSYAFDGCNLWTGKLPSFLICCILCCFYSIFINAYFAHPSSLQLSNCAPLYWYPNPMLVSYNTVTHQIPMLVLYNMLV